MRRHSTKLFYLSCILICAGTAVSAQGQEAAYPAAEAQQTLPAAQAAWSAEQLDNLVAPIALYPDPLLGQILVACTYPLEVVEANQWLQRNRSLSGQALVDAAKQQPWDPSVQALVAVPDALARLNQDIRWTTDLGNAFLAQQPDVMSAVQRMRARAKANGRLASTPQQTVSTQEQGGQQVVVIQPASPQVIYVPAYDPFYVWGPPVYGYYPPLYYPSYGFGFGIGFDLGFCFGGWGGWSFWGWGPNWYGHTVFVNNYFFHRHGFHHPYGGAYYGHAAWVHNPVHRMRIPYSNSHVAARYGGSHGGDRNSYRGNEGQRSTSFAGSNRQEGRNSGGSVAQGLRQSSPPAQRTSNPPRQQSEEGRYNRATPDFQRYSSSSQPGYQGQQQDRSAPVTNRENTRVIPFGSRSQSTYQPPEVSRSLSQSYRAPQVQGNQPPIQGRYQSLPSYGSAPQVAPPRFGGSGSFNRGSSSFGQGYGGSSRGGGSSFSQGIGGFSRGSGGGVSPGGSRSYGGGAGRSFSGGGASRQGGGIRR